MCGRFANSETIPVLAQRWSAEITDGADWEPNDDIRPSQRAPVLLEGSDQPRRLGLMTWGWARDFARSGSLINARSEDALRKPTFAEAMHKRRCLVPATSWFEWQAVPNQTKKTKHRLAPDGTEIWALAGLWEPRTAPDGQTGAAFVVLTTAAHPSVAHVHDRMPCIIALEHASAWLCGEADDLLTPFPGNAEVVPK